MKTIITSIFLICFLSTTVLAQGKITKIPWAGTLISKVNPKQKHKVPFPGILLDSEAWAEIQKTKEEFQKKLEIKDLNLFKLEVQKNKEIELLKIEIKFSNKLHKERMNINKNHITNLENIIKEDSGSINLTPWIFLGGVVVGALTAIAISYSVK